MEGWRKHGHLVDSDINICDTGAFVYSDNHSGTHQDTLVCSENHYRAYTTNHVRSRAVIQPCMCSETVFRAQRGFLVSRWTIPDKHRTAPLCPGDRLRAHKELAVMLFS